MIDYYFLDERYSMLGQVSRASADGDIASDECSMAPHFSRTLIVGGHASYMGPGLMEHATFTFWCRLPPLSSYASRSCQYMLVTHGG